MFSFGRKNMFVCVQRLWGVGKGREYPPTATSSASKVVGSPLASLILCLHHLGEQHMITQVFTLFLILVTFVVPMISLPLRIFTRGPSGFLRSPLPLCCSLSLSLSPSLSFLTTPCYFLSLPPSVCCTVSLSLLPVLPYGSRSLSALWTDQQEISDQHKYWGTRALQQFFFPFRF